MSADAAGDALPYDHWQDADVGDTDDVDDAIVHQFEQRVTVDFDAKHQDGFTQFELRATRIYHNLDDVADRVDVHVSSGQRGLHFVAWFEDAVPFDEQVAYRREHGDDKRRIDMDVQRWHQLGGRFTDVLFSQKGDRDMVKERRFADVYDALDYIAARRSDHDRMRDLANEGHKGAPDLARRARRAES